MHTKDHEVTEHAKPWHSFLAKHNGPNYCFLLRCGSQSQCPGRYIRVQWAIENTVYMYVSQIYLEYPNTTSNNVLMCESYLSP